MAIGSTFTNPNGYTTGTSDDDTFIINDEGTAFRTLVAKEGYDRLSVDRSSDNTIGVNILYSERSGLIATIDSRASNAYSISAYDFENITVKGSSKNDYFSLQSGPVAESFSVTLDGGPGDDALIVDLSAFTRDIRFSAANGSITSSYGAFTNFETFTVSGGSGNDSIEGSAGNDEIRGGGGTNTLIGGGGDDVLISQSISDFSDGGTGIDSWSLGYGSGSGVALVTLGGNIDINGRVVARNVEYIGLGLGQGDDQVSVTSQYSGGVAGGSGFDKIVFALANGGPQNVVINGYGSQVLQGSVDSLSFSDFEQFVSYGSSGNDNFQVSGSFDASQVSADGGSGNDKLTLDLSAYATSSNLTVGTSGSIASNRGQYGGFESFIITGGVSGDRFTTAGGDDVLAGGKGGDTLQSGSGADLLLGQEGSDYLNGGDGDDYLYGDDFLDLGADTLIGGRGDDRYFAIDAQDTLTEGINEGNDSVSARSDFTLPDNFEDLTLVEQTNLPAGLNLPLVGIGNGLNNVLVGNEGNNRLVGLAGNDRLEGGSGNDLLEGGTGADTLIGDLGDDTLVGGRGADTLDGGFGTDIFLLETALDTTTDAPDYLRNFQHGVDLVDISALNVVRFQFNVVSASGARPAYTNVTLTTQAGDTALLQIDGVASQADFRNMPVLTGTSADDSLTGGAADDYLAGLAGNDTLNGLAGNDTLQGGTGADSMTGGAGDDVYVVDQAADVVIEAAGGGRDTVLIEASYALASDTEVEVLSTSVNAGTTVMNLTGNGYAQVIVGNYGANILTGGGTGLTGGGIDVLIGLLGDDRYVVDSARLVIFENTGEGADVATVTAAGTNFVLNAGASVETVQAASGTDAINITGNPDAQTLVGNDGANILSGAGGGDTLVGLGGNDTYQVRSTADQVVEANGGGVDTVFATVSYNLGANEVEVLSTVVNAATDSINLIGNYATQLIIGNYGSNILNGGSGGVDTLVGLRGDDTYAVGDARVIVSENAGEGYDTVVTSVSYQLRTGASIEAFTAQNRGGTEALVLVGNEVSQILVGNEGANTLDGRGGIDNLVGGGGADVFAFTVTPTAGNADSILDFQAGTDRIGLASDVFAAVTDGGITAGEFVVGTAAQDADDRLIYDQATSRLFWDADGNGSGAAVLLAQLNAGTSLTASSFVVVAPVADLVG